tara:strand:- start:12136 stop:12687 length:552 start_codon:yes stop_codon:yes gene_type:complete
LKKIWVNIIKQSNLSKNKSNDFELVTRIEAVLYLKGKPVSKKSISEITNSDFISVDSALKILKIKYSEESSALELIENKNDVSLELKQSLNEFVEDLLPAELNTAVLRTLATVAIKKRILQSDLIILRGSSAYEHIKELYDKKLITKRKQKEGRSYWLSLSEKFFQTFAVSDEFLSDLSESKK